MALDGKVLIDVANPIAPDSGFPPALSIVNTDSLGELIQREFPAARVVKTLNTVNAEVMVQPTLVPGDHTIFVCGNDADAKGTVVDILAGFGWPTGAVVDLGDITAARGAEMYLALWLRMMQATGSARFNIKLVTG